MTNYSHAANTQWLINAILTSPGDIEPSLRRAIESYSAQLGDYPATQPDAIPPELTNYVKKVALHAYKTTDEDIEALRKAGYSEDAIFEITLNAALGAGIARLERGLAALKGDENATSEA